MKQRSSARPCAGDTFWQSGTERGEGRGGTKYTGRGAVRKTCCGGGREKGPGVVHSAEGGRTESEREKRRQQQLRD